MLDQNTRVFVTAGAQGIGKAISEHFIDAGVRLAVHYHSSDAAAAELVQMAEAKGVSVRAFKGDLTDPEVARSVTSEAIVFLGGLDVLVNNAGSMVERRLADAVDDDYWNYVFALNMTSAQVVTQAALAALTENTGSAIVNLSSIAGRRGGGLGGLAYSSAKGAMIAWTRTLASEIGPQGVRVNAVAPGLILNTQFHANHSSPEAIAKTIASTPLQRAGTPADVARAVLFLASERHGFITGATLDINGGTYCA